MMIVIITIIIIVVVVVVVVVIIMVTSSPNSCYVRVGINNIIIILLIGVLSYLSVQVELEFLLLLVVSADLLGSVVIVAQPLLAFTTISPQAVNKKLSHS